MIDKLLFWFSRAYFGVNVINVENINNTKQKVFFANHSSHLDTITILAALPENIKEKTRPIAAADYWGKNCITRYVSKKLLKCVLINRIKKNNATGEAENPLDCVYTALEEGSSIVIFPEGTRNNSETMLQYKSGIFNIYQKYPGVEFIPIYLKNANRSMPKGVCHPLPLICSVHFGKPLDFIENEAKEDFLIRARQAVIEIKESL